MLHARTLGAARSDPTAAHMVELQLPTYLEQQWQDADLGADVDEADWIEERSQDDAAFDADDFWGEDDFMEWHPELTTSVWLATERMLSERYTRPDTGWGFDYSPAPTDQAEGARPGRHEPGGGRGRHRAVCDSPDCHQQFETCSH